MTTALIVGGDSSIGQRVAAGLAVRGLRVISTTRRPELVGAGRVFLDLNADLEEQELPQADLCLVAAAVAQMETCRRDPVGSARVNVDATLAIARRMADRGGFTLFLSTNQVFDGTRPHRRADEPTCPISEYGRQKAMAEASLATLGTAAAILRKTKVASPDMPVLRRWAEALRQDKPVDAFSDMVLAPVDVELAVEAACRVLERRSHGIHHLSGDVDVAYVDLARELATRLGVDPALVRPSSAAAAGLGPEVAPTHTTLDCTGLDRLDLAPPLTRTCVTHLLDAVTCIE